MTLEELFDGELRLSAPERFVRRVAQVRGVAECILWPFGRNSMGYGHYRARTVTHYAHRAVCAAAHGPADRRWVLHGCDTPGCVNPDHLRWGSAQENAEDREVRRRVFGRGSLTSEDVAAIRLSTARGVALAQRFGVSESTISRVRNHKTRAADKYGDQQ